MCFLNKCKKNFLILFFPYCIFQKFCKHAQVSSPWLVDPYSRWILTVINGILSLSLAAFLLYLISYHLCCHGCSADPLWPVMTAYEYKVEGVETMKYLATVLQGRAIIGKRTRQLSVLF